uniref:Pentatricopeptide repeat-containing protein n=1 Tax=Oryza punctata TaxID=4537 RepID=A0A0E0MC78_ORYPU
MWQREEGTGDSVRPARVALAAAGGRRSDGCGGRTEATVDRSHGHLGQGGNDGIAIRVGLKPTASFLPGDCPFAVVACHRKMTTLDGLVWGRGDPFLSLTLSLSNPTTWMELKRTGGRNSTLMANQRGYTSKGIVGGSAESDMYSLARESRNHGQKPSLRVGNGDACGRRFSPWDIVVKTTSWFSRTGGGGDPGNSAYNAIIFSLCRHNMLGEALDFKNRMAKKGYVPKPITFLSLLYGFRSVGKSMNWRTILPNEFQREEFEIILRYKIV